MADFAQRSERLASRLGISRAAAELYLGSEVLDLHVESFSFTRSFGYDLNKRHGPGLNEALLFGQADFPRLLEAEMAGGVFSITANPLRPVEDRAAAFRAHLADFLAIVGAAGPRFRFVRSLLEYEEARWDGALAIFAGVQGANALPPEPEDIDEFAADLVKVCLLHLTSSSVGSTSTFRSLSFGASGLRTLGFDLVHKLNEKRILVDLAHIHPRAFWDAFHAADPSVPLIVSHTGVSAVHPHWRNIDDEQIRAVASRGGTIGIIYHSAFLGDGLLRGRVSTVVRHVRHVIDTVGDDFVSLGSDWDGLICTPRDMPTCLELPRLVEALLKEGVAEESIQKILGLNFLRVLRALDRDSLPELRAARRAARSSGPPQGPRARAS